MGGRSVVGGLGGHHRDCGVQGAENAGLIPDRLDGPSHLGRAVRRARQSRLGGRGPHRDGEARTVVDDSPKHRGRPAPILAAGAQVAKTRFTDLRTADAPPWLRQGGAPPLRRP